MDFYYLLSSELKFVHFFIVIERGYFTSIIC